MLMWRIKQKGKVVRVLNQVSRYEDELPLAN